MTTVGLLILGMVVGVLSAMMGIGGGIVLVPALTILFGLSQSEAQGTSLATIPFGAVIAALIYNQNVALRLSVIVAISIGFIVGPISARGLLHSFRKRSCGWFLAGFCSISGSFTCSTRSRRAPPVSSWRR
jgi:hypothetical protein